MAALIQPRQSASFVEAEGLEPQCGGTWEDLFAHERFMVSVLRSVFRFVALEPLSEAIYRSLP